MARWFFVILAVISLAAVLVFRDGTNNSYHHAQMAVAILLAVFILFLVFGSQDKSA